MIDQQPFAFPRFRLPAIYDVLVKRREKRSRPSTAPFFWLALIADLNLP